MQNLRLLIFYHLFTKYKVLCPVSHLRALVIFVYFRIFKQELEFGVRNENARTLSKVQLMKNAYK